MTTLIRTAHVLLFPDNYFLCNSHPLSWYAGIKHRANSPLIGGSSSDFHDNTSKCKKRKSELSVSGHARLHLFTPP